VANPGEEASTAVERPGQPSAALDHLGDAHGIGFSGGDDRADPDPSWAGKGSVPKSAIAKTGSSRSKPSHGSSLSRVTIRPTVTPVWISSA
jgi:hypothetical protein